MLRQRALEAAQDFRLVEAGQFLHRGEARHRPGVLEEVVFVAADAGHQGDIAGLAVGDGVHRQTRQQVAVHHRLEIHRELRRGVAQATFHQGAQGLILGGDPGFRVGLAQLVGGAAVTRQRLHEGACHLGHLFRGEREVAGAGLHDGGLEQGPGAGRGHQGGDTEAAGGFAEQGDPVGPAAERFDVPVDPFQRRHLVA